MDRALDRKFNEAMARRDLEEVRRRIRRVQVDLLACV